MKVGLLGAGKMGSVHAHQYSQMGDIELFICDDLSLERATILAETHEAKPVESTEELLQLVDVVDICYPTHVHFETAEKVIRSGKPFIIEKPFARTIVECQKLLQIVRESGSTASVAHVVRYFPEHQLIHQMVKAGKVGTPASARLKRAGRCPQGINNWFRDHAKSGGVLLDLAIHDFDWLSWTFGEVSEVSCHSARLGENQRDIEGDYALTIFTFESGLVAHVESSWMEDSPLATSVEISGSEGLVEFDSNQSKGMVLSTQEGKLQTSPQHQSVDPYFLELKGFLEAVKEGSEPPISMQDGFNAVALAESAIESAKTGKPVCPKTVLQSCT